MADTAMPKFNFDDIDLDSIDPDRLPIGTSIHDCSQIASVFERGAHSTPSEAATFAVLTRSLQNNKKLATTTADSMQTYLSSPQDSSADAAAQAAAFGADTGSQGGGEVAQTDHSLQSFNVGTQKQSTHGDTFGSKLLSFARDCIPCNLRMAAFLELHPNIDMLKLMEDHLDKQLRVLGGIADLLTNFDSYGDLCGIMNLLSFMCIPDLQRIIATLMALLMLDVPKLDGLIGMLQALIVPMFAPVLMAITSLLDQFIALVTGPLQCVLVAINEQLRKLDFSKLPEPLQASEDDPIVQARTGIRQLQVALAEGKARIENKLDFYVKQVQAMLGELGGSDSAYLLALTRKLKIVRLIAFVSAIIRATALGHAACSTAKQPGLNEIDNFFHTFLNPNSPFDMWVDDDGQMHIDEKIEGQAETLPNTENVLQFEGEPLLESVAIQAEEVAATLSTPVRALIPCRLELETGDISKVNEWMAELNKSS